MVPHSLAASSAGCLILGCSDPPRVGGPNPLIPFRPKVTCFQTSFRHVFSKLGVSKPSLSPLRVSALRVPILLKVPRLPEVIPCHFLYPLLTLRPMALRLTPCIRRRIANALNNPLNVTRVANTLSRDRIDRSTLSQPGLRSHCNFTG